MYFIRVGTYIYVRVQFIQICKLRSFKFCLFVSARSRSHSTEVEHDSICYSIFLREKKYMWTNKIKYSRVSSLCARAQFHYVVPTMYFFAPFNKNWNIILLIEFHLDWFFVRLSAAIRWICTDFPMEIEFWNASCPISHPDEQNSVQTFKLINELKPDYTAAHSLYFHW